MEQMEQRQPAPNRSECGNAFGSIRATKNLTAMLIVLCILVQIGATLAVHFARILDEVPISATPTTQTDPAAEPTTRPADTDADFSALSKVMLRFGLPGTRFAALVLCLLLVLMVMFAVKLSLVERAGGMAGFMSAFNWSLILLVMLIPWQQILSSSISCGALFNLSELTNADAALGKTPSILEQVIFYARFIGYPCVALFTCLIVQAKFAKGFSNVNFNLDESR
ncbi:MAG: hypothetical protein GY794_21350 [bacterium]|nr:hypothetical protein [bacterium]